MFHYRDFRVTDRKVLFNFIASYPFATIAKAYSDEQFPADAYAPVIQTRQGVQFHIAKANSAYPVFEKGGKVLISFMGPNGHVSPSWYRERFAGGDRSQTAPTWDYGMVRLRGILQPMEKPKLHAHLRRLVGQFEGALANGWDIKEIDPAFRRRLVNFIAGYDVKIVDMEGYFKLSQDQLSGDREHIAEALEKRGQGFDAALAGLIRSYG